MFIFDGVERGLWPKLTLCMAEYNPIWWRGASTLFTSEGGHVMTIIKESSTPLNVEINPRNPEFDLEEVLSRDWHNNDPFKTAYSNALSLTFPLGEKYFINSVKPFKDRIKDPKLQREVIGFYKQEIVHSNEHQNFNETLCRVRGYDLDELERPLRRRLNWVYDNLSRVRMLAGTVAMEHFTAILADGMLKDPRWLEGVDPAIAPLWRWHAIEETEHKSVAFDVFQRFSGNTKTRRRAMIMSTFFLWKDVFRNMRIMLEKDGNNSFKVWWKGLNWLFGKPGLMRSILPQYFAFFKKDFHPWQHDNRELITRWETEMKAEMNASEQEELVPQSA